MKNNLLINRRKINRICQKWKIREFSLFGSILRNDFNKTSDVDVLVSFEPNSKLSLMEIVQIKDELKTIFGREIDIVEKEAIRNPFRKQEILSSREVIYG